MEYKRLTKRDKYGRVVGGILMTDIAERLAELEDKIEDGTMIELPCNVGDTVYYLMGDEIFEDVVRGFIYNPSDMGLRIELTSICPIVKWIGNILFFTREQAEARLAKLRGNA